MTGAAPRARSRWARSPRVASAAVALLLAGCGASTQGDGGATTTASTTTAVSSTLPQGHPQAVQPVAGEAGGTTTSTPPSQTGSVSGPTRDPFPTAPASGPISAPAAGAPTDAEVRAEIAKFQAAVKKYHLDQLNLTGDLLNPALLPPGPYNVSIASVFTDYGLPVACGGVEHVAELGVANKTLPCGTEVIFIYNGRAVRVPVIDRGPYIAGREWDLTGATAEALHFPGLGPIEWILSP